MNDRFLRRALQFARDFEPIDRPDERDWEEAEREIGWKMPRQHKEFVSHFGSGRFGDDLYLMNPRAKGVCRLSADSLTKYAQKKALLLADIPRRVFPDTSLILVATTTSRLDWFVDAEQEGGLIFFDLGVSSVFDLPMSFAEFVCRLYTNELPYEWNRGFRSTIWSSPDTPFFKPMSNV